MTVHGSVSVPDFTPTSIIDSMDCRCASARESFGSQVLARNVPTISLALASSLTLEIEEQKITFFYYLAELRCINGRNIAPPERQRTSEQKAKRRAYRQRPEVKAKRRAEARAYRQKHRKQIKARERADYRNPDVRARKRALEQARWLAVKVFGTDVSLFLDYDYMHFGTKQAPLLSTLTRGEMFPLDITQNVNVVLFGINYRFFGGPQF